MSGCLYLTLMLICDWFWFWVNFMAFVEGGLPIVSGLSFGLAYFICWVFWFGVGMRIGLVEMAV